ncbi:MAG: hypothetical protein LPH21_12620 [Shewanella sp.]|nr:hypothetical protein [Shewanella sp.]
MKKTLTMTMIAASMMTTQAFAWNSCELLEFRTLKRFVMPDQTDCRHGTFMSLTGGRAILLMEPKDGGLINCDVAVVDIYGVIDLYGVTKLSCNHPNPQFANKMNLVHGLKSGIVANKDEIVKAHRSRGNEWEHSELWVK